MPKATSIKIFLADGVPDGIRIVSKSNWTGQAVVAGRAQLGDALSREEMTRPGVYVLTGPDPDGSDRVYIGEADALGKRIKQHAAKDFWTRFVAFSASDGTINKAHVRYLESELIALAIGANQWSVDNATAPPRPPMSEADQADADWFLDEMLVIFPLLGIDAFDAASDTSANDVSAHSTQLVLEQRGAKARGREAGEEFIVLADSLARATETNSIHGYLHDLRHRLVNKGVLVPQGSTHLRFTQDFRFGSPSTAAGVLVGGAANGRTAWKAADGRSLKAVQEARTDSG